MSTTTSTTSLRTSILVATADTAVLGNGVAVYTGPSAWGKKDSRINMTIGQFVFMDATTKLGKGTTATKSTVPLVKIGVAVDNSGKGIPDDIRWANDGISGCSLRDLDGRAANCGLGNIADLHWGQVVCGQTYTIEVEAHDPITEAFGGRDLGYIYSFSYTHKCGDCSTGDCVDPTPNADEVMCGLYNKIKGIHNDPNWDILLNDLPLPVDHEYRFDVAKLFDGDSADFADDTTFEFCLTQTDGDCVSCDRFTDIGGYSLGEGTVLFSPATYINDGETFYSTRGHIESVVSQLEAALGGNGSVVFLPAVGNCCTTHKLEINTCLLDFALFDGEGVEIEPCNASNPFSAWTVYSECQDCNSANGTITPVAGLRFYSKPFEGECQCLAGNKAHAEYYSEVIPYFRRGWKDGCIRKLVRQHGTIPEGQGFFWQAKEIQNLRYAFNAPFVVNNWGGKYGFPEDNDLLNQVTVDCKDSYCVISGTIQSKTRHDVTGETSSVPQTLYILIPTSFTTAQTSILLALNNYFTGGDCGLATISCA